MKPTLILLLLAFLFLSAKNHSPETKEPPGVLSFDDPEYPDLPLTPVSELF